MQFVFHPYLCIYKVWSGGHMWWLVRWYGHIIMRGIYTQKSGQVGGNRREASGKTKKDNMWRKASSGKTSFITPKTVTHNTSIPQGGNYYARSIVFWFGVWGHNLFLMCPTIKREVNICQYLHLHPPHQALDASSCSACLWSWARHPGPQPPAPRTKGKT